MYVKYYPLEISQEITKAEKRQHMIDWWIAAHETLASARISQSDIAAMAAETPVPFRAGAHHLVEACQQRHIPFLVFSAGIGGVFQSNVAAHDAPDIIQEVLLQANLLTPNVHVISNWMDFDERGVCTKFKDPIVHVMNKNEISAMQELRESDDGRRYFQSIAERPNVLLLGDSLGDVQMSHGIPHDVCLNVGFLNHSVPDLLPTYLDTFDIVLTNDVGFQVVKELLDIVQ